MQVYVKDNKLMHVSGQELIPDDMGIVHFEQGGQKKRFMYNILVDRLQGIPAPVIEMETRGRKRSEHGRKKTVYKPAYNYHKKMGTVGNHRKRPVVAVDSFNNILPFESTIAASKVLKVHRGNITRSLKWDQRKAGGYKFYYKTCEVKDKIVLPI